MHAEFQDENTLNYCVLQRFVPECREIGASDAASGPEVGVVPLETVGVVDFATRRAAAMMANNTVLRASSSDTIETIPASQACARNCGSCGSRRVTNTTRSGLDKGRGSRANASSSRTSTPCCDRSGLFDWLNVPRATPGKGFPKRLPRNARQQSKAGPSAS